MFCRLHYRNRIKKIYQIDILFIKIEMMLENRFGEFAQMTGNQLEFIKQNYF